MRHIHLRRIFIEMIIHRQLTLCVYHSLLEAPLGLEDLGLSLHNLLVNLALGGGVSYGYC